MKGQAKIVCVYHVMQNPIFMIHAQVVLYIYICVKSPAFQSRAVEAMWSLETFSLDLTPQLLHCYTDFLFTKGIN